MSDGSADPGAQQERRIASVEECTCGVGASSSTARYQRDDGGASPTTPLHPLFKECSSFQEQQGPSGARLTQRLGGLRRRNASNRGGLGG